MADNNLDLLNLVSDLRRAARFLVISPNKECPWIQNIVESYQKLSQSDLTVKKIINIDLISDISIAQKEKAEYILMMSQQLKNYLFK